MKVKIIKCSGYWWYYKDINKIKDVEEQMYTLDDGVNFRLLNSPGYLLATDCEIIDETSIKHIKKQNKIPKTLNLRSDL